MSRCVKLSFTDNESVQSSIAEVAQGFVSPESYSIDVDRLLLGRESSLRTASVGVLQIVIHGAEDLPKTDTMGSCDPYVAISYSKFNKPGKQNVAALGLDG